MKFSGVMIGSTQPDVLGAFYSQILGAPDFRDGTWYGWGENSTGAQLMLGAHSEVQGQNPSPQRIMLSISVSDVQSAFEHVTGLGAPIVAKPYQPDENGKYWLATVEDPDGNFVQLATPWE